MENFGKKQENDFFNSKEKEDDNSILNELKEEDRKLEREKNNYRDFEDILYDIKFKTILDCPYKFVESKVECFTLRFEKLDNMLAAGIN